MHLLTRLASAMLAASTLACCAPRVAWDPRSLGDLAPPVFLGVSVQVSAVEMRFDEPVELVEGSLILEPGAGAPAAGEPEARAEGMSLLIATPDQTAGQEYRVEATVRDASGNSSAVVARFYGFNGEVPRMLINELTTRGTGSHPDLVEIRVLSDGDLAGVTLNQGTESDWIDRIIFPACPVTAGEYLVVHFRPDGSPEERDETGARDASGGADASPTARDFWVRGGQGLSGNNGVLTLAGSPAGGLLDGILYSNRTSDSDSAYGGFGSASVLARARDLQEHGGWVAPSGTVCPEDAVNPEGSTGTRSIARSRSGADTNSNRDWHITPTRGATWGAENSDERYDPASR